MNPLLLLGIGVAAAAAWWFSKGEDSGDISNTDADMVGGIAITDEFLSWLAPIGLEATIEADIRARARDILSIKNSLGTYGLLYYYGGPSADIIEAGDIRALLDSDGGDCSGVVLTMAVHAGLCSGTWALNHRSTMNGATPLIASLDEVIWEDVEVGDIACYNGHVGIVVGFSEDRGEGKEPLILSMSGGYQSTKGDNPNARAKVQYWDYRQDFIKFGRFPESATA